MIKAKLNHFLIIPLNSKEGILMYLIRSIILLAILTLFVACTMVQFPGQKAAKTEQTQLQTRQFQTREYDTNDTKLIMKAVVNVLQDEGFIIKNAVVDLGLISATKEIDLSKENSASSDDGAWAEIFRAFFKSNKGHQTMEEKSYRKFELIEASLNVSQFGKQSKVRANFQAKIIDNKGNPIEVFDVDDPRFYQDFFAKVDKGIFIQKQGF